jgi:hypothetical protein
VTALALGVVGFNAILVAVGYCLLALPLAGASRPTWASYCGIALLVGASLVGVGVFLAATAGFTTGARTFTVVAALLALAGLAARFLAPGGLRRWAAVPPAPAQPPMSPRARLATVVLSFAVVAIAAFALVGGFRSSPWLDDVWGIWLPKGVALHALGLDTRLFTDSGRFVSFEVLDYPLWWAILVSLDLDFVGSIDLRAANAQLTLLALALLAATARLLVGYVRPWLLAGALLLLAAAPEFFRHAQGGIADLPLAIYLALYGLAAIGWLASRRGFYLLLAFTFAAAALAIKSEGLPQIVVVLAVVTLVGWRAARQALPSLWVATAAALLTAVPWAVWRAVHDVASQVSLSEAFGLGYLAERTERVRPSVEAILRHVTTPREWLVVVPLFVALALVGALRHRRLLPLAPLLLLAALFGFWVWAYWAETESLDYLLSTSSYRIADSLVLMAWILLPLQGELVLARAGSEGKDLAGWLVAIRASTP